MQKVIKNLYQEATVRNNGLVPNSERSNIKAVYCHPAYLTYMQNTSCKMLGWMKHKLESSLSEISTTSDKHTTLMAENEEELQTLLMRVKDQSEKAVLKLSLQRSWHPVPSHHSKQVGKEWKQWQILLFLDFRVTAISECNQWHLLLGRKAMTNLDSILKSRNIPLLTKVCLVKAMVFPVVIYRYESWIIKKAEHQSDAFELWCWRRIWRVPWTAGRSS